MKSLSYLYLIMLIVFGCNNKNNNIFKKIQPNNIIFEKTYELKGEELEIDAFVSNNLIIFDTLIILVTPQSETLYHAISTNDYNWDKKFIRKGEGPNEFQNVLKPLSYEKKDNDLLLTFYDKAREGLFHYNLTQSFNQGIDIFQDTISLGETTEIYRAYKITDNKVFIDNLDFINLNQIYSVYEDKKIISTDTALVSGLINQSDSYIMTTITSFNKNKLKYAGAMMFMDQINIYDINNPNNSLAITANNNNRPSINEVSQTLMPYKNEFYVDLRQTDSYIFGLYANQSRKEWATGDNPGVIHILDWEGNPICKLKTKEKLIHFDIDSNSNTLYGMTEKEEIIKYNLDEISELAQSGK
ncbi:TolB-like 6-bladed beta-propeller domain-containing protein [Algoriphagus antarcticus]|uniref:TolB-like protein n=1 Tax=Algoriphagus antarcticus TaxID=238540 RepID=A0A3E0D741_9BACT|nr:hypothetical protein [Algoriphagus antarcticus]REG78469.1 TolB-like protein [Algoriphagus antarcticus]